MGFENPVPLLRAQDILSLGEQPFQPAYPSRQASLVLPELARRTDLAGHDAREVTEFGLPFSEFSPQTVRGLRVNRIGPRLISANDHG